MVTGNIPPGSGLSSSAALIVSSLLAILAGNDFISSTPSSDSITNAELVQLARDSERILGVNSGGMDQSASVLSRPGSGLYVSFWPKLTVEAVKLPSTTVNGKEEPLAMVISNSLTTHNLASDAKRHYNLRVVETRIAARLLYHALGLQPENPATALTLREVVSRYAGEKEGERMPAQQLEKAIEDMLGEVEKVLGNDERFKKEGFTVDEMVERSGMDAVTFKRTQIDFIPGESLFERYRTSRSQTQLPLSLYSRSGYFPPLQPCQTHLLRGSSSSAVPTALPVYWVTVFGR
jgi:galactokinase